MQKLHYEQLCVCTAGKDTFNNNNTNELCAIVSHIFKKNNSSAPLFATLSHSLLLFQKGIAVALWQKNKIWIIQTFIIMQ